MPSIECTQTVEVDANFSELIVALKGCEHLEKLVDSNLLSAQPTTLLDDIYGQDIKWKLTLDPAPDSSHDDLLITKDKLETIAQEFKDDEIAVAGKRAISQIQRKHKKDEESLQEDKSTRVVSSKEVHEEKKDKDPKDRP
jgi:hypothetical protein